MSFVGPRAQPEKERVKVGEVEKEIYIRQIPGYTYRQLVKPGMTGIAQVYAPRDIPHRYKFKYDLIYVRKILSNASLQGRAAWVADFRLFCLDVKLILLAFWMTFRGKWEI
jgi:lipopolysaccharide/colanic/teichoic acid biosynthesis glycosyltransferase